MSTRPSTSPAASAAASAPPAPARPNSGPGGGGGRGRGAAGGGGRGVGNGGRGATRPAPPATRVFQTPSPRNRAPVLPFPPDHLTDSFKLAAIFRYFSKTNPGTMPLIKVAAELQRLLDLGCAGLRVYRVEAEVPHFTQEPNGSWLCKCVPIVTLQISIAEFAAPGSGYAGTTNVGLAMQRHSQTVVADGARSDAYKLFIPGASYAMWLPTNSPIARAPYQPNYVMVFSIFISADPVERYVINQDPARQAMLLEYLVAVIHDLDMGEINAIERICIPNKMWLQVEVRYNYMRRRRHPVFHAIAQDLLTRVSIDMMTTIAEEPYKIVMRQLGPNPAGDGENPECVLVPRA